MNQTDTTYVVATSTGLTDDQQARLSEIYQMLLQIAVDCDADVDVELAHT